MERPLRQTQARVYEPKHIPVDKVNKRSVEVGVILLLLLSAFYILRIIFN